LAELNRCLRSLLRFFLPDFKDHNRLRIHEVKQAPILVLVIDSQFVAASAPEKRTWGKLTVIWVAHDVRDAVVDFVRLLSEFTE
jgi:hypothetical protein